MPLPFALGVTRIDVGQGLSVVQRVGDVFAKAGNELRLRGLASQTFAGEGLRDRIMREGCFQTRKLRRRFAPALRRVGGKESSRGTLQVCRWRLDVR